MATKRFDDVAEKARALEAQAKKLRREAQAARTKAYADALVTVSPLRRDVVRLAENGISDCPPQAGVSDSSKGGVPHGGNV